MLSSSNNLFHNYDLSSYMFNANASIPFHFHWFLQDPSNKRGGTAPTNATRLKPSKPVFDTTIYKSEANKYNKYEPRISLNSKDNACNNNNVLKLYDIQKISKIYNSTNIKPEKFHKKRSTNYYATSRSNNKKNAFSLNKQREIQTSQSQRGVEVQKNNKNVPQTQIKGGLSYFLGANRQKSTSQISEQTKKELFFDRNPKKYPTEIPIKSAENIIKNPIIPLKPTPNTMVSSLTSLNTVTTINKLNDFNEISPENENLACNKGFESNRKKIESIHTDASSEPDKEDREDEEEKVEENTKKRPKMFLTAENFRENLEEKSEKDENLINKEMKMHASVSGSSEELQLVENNDEYLQQEEEENERIIEEKTLLFQQMQAFNRPKTSEGGRRRRPTTNNNNYFNNIQNNSNNFIENNQIYYTNEITNNDNNDNEKKEAEDQEKQEEEQEIVLETKNLEYIQSFQNQRPPCRKKVQAFNLDFDFGKTTIPKNIDIDFEKSTIPKSFNNQILAENQKDRPPSRHKTPPKAIGLDIPNLDSQFFPIKNMYLECVNVNREDSFNGLDVKLDNKVNLSNFVEKKAGKKEGQGRVNTKEDDKSEILEDFPVRMNNDLLR